MAEHARYTPEGLSILGTASEVELHTKLDGTASPDAAPARARADKAAALIDSPTLYFSTFSSL